MSLLRTTISDARSVQSASKPANLVRGNVTNDSRHASSGESSQIRSTELNHRELSSSLGLDNSNQGLSNVSDNSSKTDAAVDQREPSVQPVTKVKIEDRNDHVSSFESDSFNHELSSEIDVYDAKEENEISVHDAELNKISNDNIEIAVTDENVINTQFDEGININEDTSDETRSDYISDEYLEPVQDNDSIEANNTYTNHNNIQSNLSSDEIEESKNIDNLSENDISVTGAVESYIPDREPEMIKSDSVRNNISEIENESENHEEKTLIFNNKAEGKNVNPTAELDNIKTDSNDYLKNTHEHEHDFRVEDSFENNNNKNKKKTRIHREDITPDRVKQEVSHQETYPDYKQKRKAYIVSDHEINNESPNERNSPSAIINKQPDQVASTSHQELNKNNENNQQIVKTIKNKVAQSSAQVNDAVDQIVKSKNVLSDNKDNHDVQIIRNAETPANHRKTQKTSHQQGRSHEAQSTEVSIGQVDVYIESPAKSEQKQRSASISHRSSLSSRLYLRRL